MRMFTMSCLLILLNAAAGLLCAQDAAIDFSRPVIVQNYPTNNALGMNGAPLSYEAVRQLISSAETSIDVEVLYIYNPNPGSKLDEYVIQPIVKKAKSGVKVRIIVDDGFLARQTDDPGYEKSIEALSAVPNLEIRRTRYFNQGVFHVKMILVDDATFYMGSHNFDWITFELNHELGVVYKSKPLCRDLRKAFDFDWANYQNTAPAAPPSGAATSANADSANADYLITISPADIEGIPSDKQRWISLIRNARVSIDMQAMQINALDSYNQRPDKTYAEWSDFHRALVDAANRGVQVRLMFSDWEFTTNEMEPARQFLVKLLDDTTANGNVTIKYSTFPPAVPCVPYSEVDHAKYAVFDGKTVWISTANLTESYFDRCRNFSFIANADPELASRLASVFETMWSGKYVTTYVRNPSEATNNACLTSPKKQ